LSSRAPALSSDLLAIVVAVVAFIVSGAFLLLLVPDRKTATVAMVRHAGNSGMASVVPAESLPAAVAADPAAGYDLGQGTYAPTGGAGAPRRRSARGLPVERDGMTQFVAVDDIVAVHANAHYTYIFTGSAKLFCPLAIGDVESRLDAARFVRVH